MKPFSNQPAFKPTKADMKLASKQFRKTHYTQQDCFISKTRPEAACIVMNLNESEETAKPKHPKVYNGNPEEIFKSAIDKVQTGCNAEALTLGPYDCQLNTIYPFNYSVKTSPGTQLSLPKYRDYELVVDLNACQTSQAQNANDSQLIQCSKGLLEQAAAQSEKSFIPPSGMPLWGALVLGAGSFLGIVACCYYCNRPIKPTGEQRQRQTEQAQPFLNAHEDSAVPLPRNGQAPNIF
jgi:hypothetical protein